MNSRLIICMNDYMFIGTFLLSLSSRPPLPPHRCQIAAAESPSFFSCSTWSHIIDISGQTTIVVEFSRVRAALAKHGNS